MISIKKIKRNIPARFKRYQFENKMENTKRASRDENKITLAQHETKTKKSANVKGN